VVGVSHAGTVLLRELADRVRLTSAYSTALAGYDAGAAGTTRVGSR
jgi:hypothetical protein